jgi:hypothetical protein
MKITLRITGGYAMNHLGLKKSEYMVRTTPGQDTVILLMRNKAAFNYSYSLSG